MVQDWSMTQNIVQRRSDVGEQRHAVVVINDLLPQPRGQVHDQWDPHDLGVNKNGVTAPAKFAGSVAMVGCNDDDAVVVQLVSFQITGEFADAPIDRAHLESYAVVKTLPQPPTALLQR